MLKADEKDTFEEDGKTKEETYTNFEYLRAKVEVLQTELELVCSILRQENLKLKEETDAGMKDIGDEVYKILEEEAES